ncbi:MAG: hypothetical protein IPH06_01165 [Alphaproteobacteria bacterium]|jgi:hypothetical protein|nr:hypothetical protein [Alphaproteobacteria bacterium]QQS56676.1 MAG: hypothetical protein IPN28_10420 [Alphaproteobacteria bacterium]
MIKVIGAKRLLLLAVLLGVNVLLAAATYFYLIPQESETEKRLRTLRGENQTKQADFDRMQIEFEQLGQQQDKFDALKEDGFFKTQVRSVARKLFRDIQLESRVVSSVAAINPGIIEENEEAKKSNYKLLASPIGITVEAFDDADIYNYLFILEQKFPGHLSVDQMSMSRVTDISGPVLRSIATGQNPVLVKATIKMSWRTMIPDSQIIVEEQQ